MMEIRITKPRVALAAVFVLAGVGVGNLLSPLVGTALATVGQTVNISDHSSSAYFVKVDSAGKLAVGDGSGPLSVDGTVSSRPAAPGSPWALSIDIQNYYTAIAGPSTSPINITSLSVSTDAASGQGVGVAVYGEAVPGTATSCSFSYPPDITLWHIRDAGDGVTPLSFSFPTPLQWKPPANTKACLYAFAAAGPANTTTMNAVGFYGG
jgi:hypothetical protein